MMMRDLAPAVAGLAVIGICCGGPLLVGALVAAGLGGVLAGAVPVLGAAGLGSAALFAGVLVVRRTRSRAPCADRAPSPRKETT